MDQASLDRLGEKVRSILYQGSESPSKCALELYADGGVEVKQFPHLTGMSRSTAYALMSAKILPYSTVGRKRVIPRKAIAALLAAGLVNADLDSE